MAKFKDITTRHFAGKSPIERDTFNIMGSVLGGVAEIIHEISHEMSHSFRGSYSSFLTTYAQLETLLVLTSSYYQVTEKELDSISLRFKIADQCKKANMIKEGTEMLSAIFSVLLRVLNRSGAIFPKSRKAMSFKNFVEEEIK